MTDSGIENLVIGIIKQAVDDYSAALRYMRHHMSPEFLEKSQVYVSRSYYVYYQGHRRNRSDCEAFFKSEWIRQLTQVDPKKIRQRAIDLSYKHLD